MIKSMTGFASLTHEDDRATIGVTIRAVNHRFLDMQLRVPQSLGDVESSVRALLQKRLSRGRVELAISVQMRTPAAPTPSWRNSAREGAAAAARSRVSRAVGSGRTSTNS